MGNKSVLLLIGGYRIRSGSSLTVVVGLEHLSCLPCLPHVVCLPGPFVPGVWHGLVSHPGLPDTFMAHHEYLLLDLGIWYPASLLTEPSMLWAFTHPEVGTGLLLRLFLPMHDGIQNRAESCQTLPLLMSALSHNHVLRLYKKRQIMCLKY